jgi:hypothetical protein
LARVYLKEEVTNNVIASEGKQSTRLPMLSNSANPKYSYVLLRLLRAGYGPFAKCRPGPDTSDVEGISDVMDRRSKRRD